MAAGRHASTVGCRPPTCTVAHRGGGRPDRSARLGQVHPAGLPGGSARSPRRGPCGSVARCPATASAPIRGDGPRLRSRAPSASCSRTPSTSSSRGRVIDEVQHGLVGRRRPRAEATQRATRMLERLHLSHLAAADPFTLSGGEQRRLSVGTALALDPGILLLDEPTFGQDPATWAELVDIIADHRDAGGTVVMATHDPDLVRALGAREVRAGSPATGRPSRARSRSSAPATFRPGPAAGSGGCGGSTRWPCSAPAMLLSTAALVSASVGLNLVLALGAVLGGTPRRAAPPAGGPAGRARAARGGQRGALERPARAPVASPQPSSWAAAALPASRVLAVALPGLVAAVAMDPTGLADALVVAAAGAGPSGVLRAGWAAAAAPPGRRVGGPRPGQPRPGPRRLRDPGACAPVLLDDLPPAGGGPSPGRAAWPSPWTPEACARMARARSPGPFGGRGRTPPRSSWPRCALVAALSTRL